MAEQFIGKSEVGNIQLNLGEMYKCPVFGALKSNKIAFDFFTIHSVSTDLFMYTLNDKGYTGVYQPAYDCTVIFWMPSEVEIDAGKVMVPVGFSYGNCQSLMEYFWQPEKFQQLLTVVTFEDSEMVQNVKNIICEAQDGGDCYYNLSGILKCF